MVTLAYRLTPDLNFVKKTIPLVYIGESIFSRKQLRIMLGARLLSLTVFIYKKIGRRTKALAGRAK